MGQPEEKWTGPSAPKCKPFQVKISLGDRAVGALLTLNILV